MTLIARSFPSGGYLYDRNKERLTPRSPFALQLPLETVHDLNISPMRPQYNRGDKTPLELFITGVQGWEAGLRKFENGKSR
jgi:hypothetical protein